LTDQGPAQAGDPTTPETASTSAANQEDLSREQQLAAAEADAYLRAGHDWAAVNETLGE
jgi:hypothetical protein